MLYICRRGTALLPLALLAVLSILGAIVAGSKDREPSYQGISLSSWLRRYADGEEGAGTAIRSIGTNALPSIVAMLRAKDSRAKQLLYYLVERMGAPEVDLNSALQQQLLACAGLEALGTSGKPALSEVARLLPVTNASWAASLALASMGHEGVQMLRDSLTNRSFEIRTAIVSGLGNAQSDPRCAAAALLEAAQDAHQAVRAAAAQALGNLRAEPLISVEALTVAALDSSRVVRVSALVALGRFGIAAEPAVGLVRQATNDPDLLIRAAALASLTNIERQRSRKGVAH